ncbi:MAG TPA: hypothetical protein VMF11_01750 [Candidatus Baltobacteraceae bacterium]|nr:hypothetical protein [Candidatus Baltobacteraceae bacterium]
MEATRRDSSRDFDFVFGDWIVRHRRLRHPLRGNDDWYEFEGTSRQWPLWGGKGNVEEAIAQSPLGPIEGSAIRFHDRATGEWSIYWGTSDGGLVTTPNVGTFDERGIGEFFARDVFDGRPIISRYRWTPLDADHCRWEQHFSIDDGASWELNWIMEFTRA